MQVREFGAITHVTGIFLHGLNVTYGAHVHMCMQKCWGVGRTYITYECIPGSGIAGSGSLRLFSSS